MSLIAGLLFLVKSSSAQLQQYDRTLEELSEPQTTRWQHFGPPYFSTNEKLLNRFYSRFDNAGGVTVGVSFQQNLSLLVHARPKLCIIFDYNPGVTEILVPFMGQLMAGNPTRREFLATLLGASVTSEETTQLLEGREPAATVLTKILERTSPEKRTERLAQLRSLLQDQYLARLPPQATPYMRAQALKWIDILQNEELLTGAFFADAIAPYQLSSLATERSRLAGWLSSEDNYALVRRYWMEGRIVGVTGDISGSSVAKVSSWLRSLHLEVSTLYLSNVGLSIEGHFPESWFRDLYTSLGSLPVTSKTLTLIAHGPWQLTGFVRSLQQAQWVYNMLADVPEQTVIRLHEAPLEVLTQLGVAKFLPAVDQGLRAVNAAQPYHQLLREVQANPAAIRAQTADQFRAWSAKAAPGIDTTSPIFTTILVTLIEASLLSAPQP